VARGPRGTDSPSGPGAGVEPDSLLTDRSRDGQPSGTSQPRNPVRKQTPCPTWPESNPGKDGERSSTERHDKRRILFGCHFATVTSTPRLKYQDGFDLNTIENSQPVKGPRERWVNLIEEDPGAFRRGLDRDGTTDHGVDRGPSRATP
jgi:hypothetical protein